MRFRILKDRVSVMVDTSGEGLHKRGYRAQSNEAPIKETLAASLCQLSRLRPDGHLIEIILPSLIQRTGIIKKCAFAV